MTEEIGALKNNVRVVALFQLENLPTAKIIDGKSDFMSEIDEKLLKKSNFPFQYFTVTSIYFIRNVRALENAIDQEESLEEKEYYLDEIDKSLEVMESCLNLYDSLGKEVPSTFELKLGKYRIKQKELSDKVYN